MPPDSPSATVIVPLRTDARRKINRKDQAAARRANLQLGDFPAGWTGAELDPGEPLCAGFAPNLSDLTMTGTSESPVFFTETGAGAWSSASVYLTEAHARAAFDRLARIGLLACMAKEARDENVTVNGYGPVAFPKLAEQTRAFRLRFEEQGRPLILDLVWLRVNRTVMLLFFVDVDAPLPFERELAAKVAARARNG